LTGANESNLFKPSDEVKPQTPPVPSVRKDFDFNILQVSLALLNGSFRLDLTPRVDYRCESPETDFLGFRA
jgi:hypothetical protein